MAGSRSASALWFPAGRQVECREEYLPDVGPRDIRVRTIASGLSQGTEMLVYRGQVPPDLTLDLPTLRGSFSFPIKYGYACVGRVVEKGGQVNSPERGEIVFVHHPHQTEFVVPAAMAVPLPPNLPSELGVFYANTETALNVLLDAHPRLSERVVIFGQGVVGLLIAQLARFAGAATLVTVDPIDARRALSRQTGAEHSLLPGDDLSRHIQELTGGAGADLVIEASGNPAALTAALDCVAMEGTIVVCSWYGTKGVSLPLGGPFHRGRIRIISSQVGSIAPELGTRWSRARRSEATRDFLPRLQLAPLVTQRIPFEQASAAYDLVDNRPDDVIQVVLTYGGGDV